jgi:negative regulator of flagellin synthesis FlgM
MSSINPIASSSAHLRITPATARAAATAGTITTTPRLSDRVELSGVDRFLTALRTNDIRADKVADIRSQIAAGTYDEDAKLDAVLDKVLDDIDR